MCKCVTYLLLIGTQLTIGNYLIIVALGYQTVTLS